MSNKNDKNNKEVNKEVKQVIVMRTDTQPPMRKGKMVAQGAHASISFLVSQLNKEGGVLLMEDLSEAAQLWIKGLLFTKVCVRADSLEQLLDIYEKAKSAGLEAHLITDKGLTEFNDRETVTCCAIGPNYCSNIDKITGELKLL